MRYYINSDYVAHHGIVGMHWGDRNGPPYPLSLNEHNSVTKTASSKSKRLAVQRSGGIKSLHTANSKSNVKKFSGSKNDTETEEKPKKKLTGKQKAAIIIGVSSGCNYFLCRN